MSNNQELKKGYTCPFCQKFNEFSVWVFAHMHIEITHTCDCGKVIPLKNGEVLFKDLKVCKEDLNADQAIMYNSIIMNLNNMKKESPDKSIGVIFSEMFGSLLYGEYIPPIFLTDKNNKKVMKRIERDLSLYIMKII